MLYILQQNQMRGDVTGTIFTVHFVDDPAGSGPYTVRYGGVEYIVLLWWPYLIQNPLWWLLPTQPPGLLDLDQRFCWNSGKADFLSPLCERYNPFQITLQPEITTSNKYQQMWRLNNGRIPRVWIVVARAIWSWRLFFPSLQMFFCLWIYFSVLSVVSS